MIIYRRWQNISLNKNKNLMKVYEVDMRKSTFFKLSIVGAVLLLLPRRSSKADRCTQDLEAKQHKPINE